MLCLTSSDLAPSSCCPHFESVVHCFLIVLIRFAPKTRCRFFKLCLLTRTIAVRLQRSLPNHAALTLYCCDDKIEEEMPACKKVPNLVLQVWLQEFGWTEEEKTAKLANRGGIAGPVHEALKNEPMFCFGTAVKLFYWSHLVYDINEEGSRRFSIETALGLFGLDKYELMWEKAEDTKVSNLILQLHFA